MCTCLTLLCSSPLPSLSLSLPLIPSVQQASYAASSFSSVSYCVQQTKVAFTPEDGSATQGISVSVSNSFLSRHSNLSVPSVSLSLLLCFWKLARMIMTRELLAPSSVDLCTGCDRVPGLSSEALRTMGQKEKR